MHKCIKFILFWSDTLRVSDGFSIHRQKFKTVHTAGTRQQAESSICLTNVCCCMYSLELLMMDGQTVRNTQSVIPKYNKFDTLVHLVGFIIEIITEVFKVVKTQTVVFWNVTPHTHRGITGISGLSDIVSKEYCCIYSYRIRN